MDDRMHILNLVDTGEISPEAGVRQLEALPLCIPPRPSVPGWVSRLWLAAFWSGVALLTGGALLLVGGYAWEGGVGSLIFGWTFSILGLIALLLGTWLPRSAWAAVRVHERGKRRISIVLPLPLALAGWAVRVAQRFVPQLHELDIPIDEMIQEIGHELRYGRPIVVNVNEQNGTCVQVYLGHA